MIKTNLFSKLKNFFSTLKKSDKYKDIEKYTDVLPDLDAFIDRFTGVDISIDFPTTSMLNMNIPRYLYSKYGKYSFTKTSGTNGYILTYIPKKISFIVTYGNEGRLDSNVTVKIGDMLIDYVIRK